MMNKRKYKFGAFNVKNTLTPIDGPKHSEGGVQINPKTEVEGGESTIDGFVFSDRILYTDPKGNKMSFSDRAKSIEKKYRKDNSPLAIKSKRKELARLAEEQEAFKQEIMPKESSEGIDPVTGERKMFLGGAIAAGAGAAINIGRGLFEKPRQYDKISLGRAKANLVDLDAQRDSINANAADATSSMEYNVRNNANSAGQLLGNTFVGRSRIDEQRNRGLAESFMNEENVNSQIKNQVDQFNTQIGNEETMQNFKINMMNQQAKDAKRQMLFDGIGGLLGAAGGFSTDMFKMGRDKDMITAMYDLSPEEINSLFGNTGSFMGLLGFGKNRRGKSNIRTNRTFDNSYPNHLDPSGKPIN